jgi:hypothetical protein
MNLYRELHVDSRKRTADAKNGKGSVMNLEWFVPYLYEFATNVVLPLRTCWRENIFNKRNPMTFRHHLI